MNEKSKDLNQTLQRLLEQKRAKFISKLEIIQNNNKKIKWLQTNAPDRKKREIKRLVSINNGLKSEATELRNEINSLQTSIDDTTKNEVQSENIGLEV